MLRLRSLVPVLLIALSFAACRPEAPVRMATLAPGDTLRLAVMATTDLHGWVHPWDYYQDQEEPRYGLARVATLIDSVRQARPYTLLVDAGDWLQGNPMAEYFARVDSITPYPLLAAAEALHFDAIILGNHEFNFGIENLQRRMDQTNVPFLAANVTRHGTDEPAFTPYVLIDRGGITIGIVGLTTPGSAVWDRPRVEGRLDFGDGLRAAQRYVREAREAGADMIVVVGHSGLEGETSYFGENLGPEHFMRDVANDVYGVDVVVAGHTHRTAAETTTGPDGRTVYIIQAGRWGSHLAVADLLIVADAETGVPRVTTGTVDALSVEGVSPSAAIVEMTATEHARVRAHMTQAIFETPDPWETADARRVPTPAIDLIHAAQIQATGAQLSAASAFTTSLTFGPGEVTLGHLTQLYPYENTLYMIEITGAQLRDYLEFTSQYYARSPERLEVNRSWPGFNYDMIHGVDYMLDVRRPVGERLTRLDFEGLPVAPADTFTMALNSYRALGGGGFSMIADAPVLAHIERPVRDLIAEYAAGRGVLRGNELPRSTWSLLPAR
jgi:2',3'-cyclic-nucleotide 2'-phosphodiesterase (5'-nucleotidase family)